MRNMSFTLTTRQVRNRTKTVTRRLGWKFARVGLVVMACVKCQGIPKGGHIEEITPIRFTDLRWEPLNSITQEDVVNEGFPLQSPEWFVDMFVRHNRCAPSEPVHVMTFEYLNTCAVCGEHVTDEFVFGPEHTALHQYVCSPCMIDRMNRGEEPLPF